MVTLCRLIGSVYEIVLSFWNEFLKGNSVYFSTHKIGFSKNIGGN